MEVASVRDRAGDTRMTQDRVMLLIDADNVSVDVMEQAVRLLLNQHGGLHVRRAYCTAESAVSNQAAFKRLGIKPMVNLAASTRSMASTASAMSVLFLPAEMPFADATIKPLRAGETLNWKLQ